MDSNVGAANEQLNKSPQRWLCLCLVATLTLFGLYGCEQPTQEQPTNADTPPPEPISDLTRDAWNDYHIHGVDIFSQPVECIADVKKSITQLIQEPDEALLDTARSYVSSCRDTYRKTLFFIASNQQAQQQLTELHQRINAPLEMPGFIDSVKDYPFSGIVNDMSMPLTKDALLEQHGLTDPSDVSIGFSVLAFLLWGETIYDEQHEPRPISSFIAASKWQSEEIAMGLDELDINEHPNNRRRKYLELTALILESDLNQLATTWNKNTLPPLNKSVADPLREKIKAQTAENISAFAIETKLPLFADSALAGDELAATHFSQWLEIHTHEQFQLLLDQEVPPASKQKALLAIFGIENEPETAEGES